MAFSMRSNSFSCATEQIFGPRSNTVRPRSPISGVCMLRVTSYWNYFEVTNLKCIKATKQRLRQVRSRDSKQIAFESKLICLFLRSRHSRSMVSKHKKTNLATLIKANQSLNESDLKNLNGMLKLHNKYCRTKLSKFFWIIQKLTLICF